jgi:hypothetical protein
METGPFSCKMLLWPAVKMLPATNDPSAGAADTAAICATVSLLCCLGAPASAMHQEH